MKTRNVLLTMMVMFFFTISIQAQDRIRDNDNDTRVETERNADEDMVRFRLGGTDKYRMIGSTFEFLNSGNSILIGQNAGISDDLSNNANIFIGREVGQNTTTGQNNVAIGDRALKENIIGQNNFALGRNSMEFTTGSLNVGLGSLTLRFQTTGSGNVAIGQAAGLYNQTGSQNVFIGNFAGRGTAASGKSGNVFIGYRSGYNETGNNKLYIDNTDTSDPLLHGDFEDDEFTVNGAQEVTTALGVGTGFVPSGTQELFEVNGALPGGRFVNIELTDITGAGTGNDLVQLRVPADCPNINMIESETADLGITFELDTRGNVDADGVVTSDSTMTAAEGMMVGTTSLPTGYLMAVDGKIISEELKVQDSGSWPDYVFESDYQLKSLEEVEASINANGHLPGIPSAKEVEAEGGIMIGNMQRLTIEKVEELTLYAIDANKKIKTLNKENAELKKGNDELKNTVEELIKRIEKLEKK